MASFRLVFLLFLCCCFTAVFADVITSYCNENSTIKSPQMSANIDNLLAGLATNTAQNGFAIASYGSGSDAVYGLGQCRQDVSRSDCSTCINDAASSIKTQCGFDPVINSTDQRRWYDNCFLRYLDQNFFGKVDTSVVSNLYNSDHPQSPSLFKKQVTSLISNLTSQAVVPGNKGFAKGTLGVSSSVTLYGLVQCTQDLSLSSCTSCLKTGVANLSNLCNNLKSVGCRLQYSSCILRYEIAPF
ncbi:OLC1v1006634C1 [Oldenlandia corymbosa var. corymbosa]|uniref:OLC1v1006634C1 n=1 Tax=Oldenlandia corymbosa var. corymbosa TaxID=529605 RepID=A0AAV1DK65_OLDCO|nr:OLC1v1006634C1 [Oldenlandia corymbosa var. corymbosa]